MIGNLSSGQIENLLHQQFVGRLACHYKDDIYIVPLSYAYDGKYIYCHGFDGRKLQLMRKNPKVCFEVEQMKDMANWESVLAWGEFEEITDKAGIQKGLQILLQRSLPFVSSITTHLGDAWPFTGTDKETLTKIPGIVFRIFLTEKSGKFEKAPNPPLSHT